eukprot:TRINITY_DN9437_c1_g1_i1.p1 TRINITY_DN9437_c1_g1~~TRINITY_DN9437_c1_g1_i1.p1  ORF type:complete len:377 (+),score=60.35 TRINITY_DN9437_c1_g1_i1:137-1132(+)
MPRRAAVTSTALFILSEKGQIKRGIPLEQISELIRGSDTLGVVVKGEHDLCLADLDRPGRQPLDILASQIKNTQRMRHIREAPLRELNQTTGERMEEALGPLKPAPNYRNDPNCGKDDRPPSTTRPDDNNDVIRAEDPVDYAIPNDPPPVSPQVIDTSPAQSPYPEVTRSAGRGRGRGGFISNTQSGFVAPAEAVQVMPEDIGMDPNALRISGASLMSPKRPLPAEHEVGAWDGRNTLPPQYIQPHSQAQQLTQVAGYHSVPAEEPLPYWISPEAGYPPPSVTYPSVDRPVYQSAGVQPATNPVFCGPSPNIYALPGQQRVSNLDARLMVI